MRTKAHFFSKYNGFLVILSTTTAVATLAAVHTALFKDEFIATVRTRLTLHHSAVLDVFLERTLNANFPRVDRL